MGTHPIFESDFDCLTEIKNVELEKMRTNCPAASHGDAVNGAEIARVDAAGAKGAPS